MSDLFRTGSAIFSACETYRYRLERRWGDGQTVAFIMLNPSTADAEKDDPTIARCRTRAERLGAGRLIVGNLFAIRATNPKEMLAAEEPIGPENDEHLGQIAAEADVLIAAWGAHGAHRGRAAEVRQLLGGNLHHIGLTKAGEPRHPLYVLGAAPLQRLAPEPRP